MPSTSEKLFTETWGKIEKALNNVYDLLLGARTTVEKENVMSKIGWYTVVYNAATKDQLVADKIYHRLREWLDATLKKRVVGPVLEVAKRNDQETLFRTVTEAYRNYRTNVAFGKIVFGYLGNYVTKRSGNEPVDKMYYKAFNVAVYANVKVALRDVILDQVHARRNGDRIDIVLLKNAVAIFIEVGTSTAHDEREATEIYSRDFESEYLKRLRLAYRVQSQAELTREGGHATYLVWVEQRQELELELATQLLRKSSYDLVRKATEDEMIAPHYSVIALHPDSGCRVLLRDWKVSDLERMYKLLQRVDDHKAVHLMGAELRGCIDEEGSKLMEQFNSSTSSGPLTLEKPLVTSVLELDEKYGRLIKDHMGNSGFLFKYRKDGFATFLNTPLKRRDPKPSAGENAVEEKATTFSEVLAAFVDAVLKRELKDVVDEDDEFKRLDSLVQLFTYIKEKDVFQDFYKAKLAKRLLQTTPHEELEKGFLERLQREMGKSFTHKMEGMLLDREATKRQSDKFATDRASSSLPSQLDVQVLTESHWPTYRVEPLAPPGTLRVCLESFQRFYKSTYNTRKLTWVHVLGSANMNVAFTKGKKDVTASLHQAAVLVTIDERGPISATEVAQQLQLDVRSVKPHIASMYLHKVFSMLRRVDESGAPLPVGKSIADADRFEMNTEFQHKMRKFKVPVAPTAKSHHSAGMPTDMEIEGRRKIQIDAAVVRIMKSRKTLAYRELQDLVIEQLSRYFTPQPKQIKQRVEDLITREYLRRHEDNQTMFDYLA